jgi:putative ABC transport system substrate-binding protein
VTVIFASPLTAAAKAATATIPIVFGGGGDPVRSGLVASLNRPGGNLTGATNLSVELGPKRLELLRAVVPQAALIGILMNPTVFSNVVSMPDLQAAARNAGQEIVILNVRTVEEIDAAFATAAARRVGALSSASTTMQPRSSRTRHSAVGRQAIRRPARPCGEAAQPE